MRGSIFSLQSWQNSIAYFSSRESGSSWLSALVGVLCSYELLVIFIVTKGPIPQGGSLNEKHIFLHFMSVCVPVVRICSGLQNQTL